MKDMLGGSYWHAVKSTWLPEWLSMNAVMAGMIPMMIIMMTNDMRAMGPGSLRFCGVMSLASLLGATLAYPINWWLVKNGLKHGMGTERALGKGGTRVTDEGRPGVLAAPSAALSKKPDVDGGEALAHPHTDTGGPSAAKASGMKEGAVSGARKVTLALITVVMLAGGVTLAMLRGDLAMRAGAVQGMPMPKPTGAGGARGPGRS